MPNNLDRAQHVAQARANRSHANRLLDEWSDDYCAVPWAVTATFYAAVHCVEAHLADRDQHSDSHEQRRRSMQDPVNSVPDAVYVAYRMLYGWSRRARYDWQRFDPGIVRTTMIHDRLRVVEGMVGL